VLHHVGELVRQGGLAAAEDGSYWSRWKTMEVEPTVYAWASIADAGKSATVTGCVEPGRMTPGSQRRSPGAWSRPPDDAAKSATVTGCVEPAAG
jgi:hypothetical protein